jgi:hypothetical protein
MKWRLSAELVMPGLVPGIHILAVRTEEAWMAGTSPAMTLEWNFCGNFPRAKILASQKLAKARRYFGTRFA